MNLGKYILCISVLICASCSEQNPSVVNSLYFGCTDFSTANFLELEGVERDCLTSIESDDFTVDDNWNFDSASGITIDAGVMKYDLRNRGGWCLYYNQDNEILGNNIQYELDVRLLPGNDGVSGLIFNMDTNCENVVSFTIDESRLGIVYEKNNDPEVLFSESLPPNTPIVVRLTVRVIGVTTHFFIDETLVWSALNLPDLGDGYGVIMTGNSVGALDNFSVLSIL